MAGPARKRRQPEAEQIPQAPAQPDPPVAHQDGPPEPAVPVDPQDASNSRRQGMAEIARRRAAHFANYQMDDAEEDANNVHVGSNSARTLGPWSSAVELVNARDKAAAAREDKILLARRQELEDAEVDWQPSRDIARGPRKENCIRPLFDLCVDVICEYIDCVETLHGVPDTMKVRLASAVCIKRKLTPEAAKLFVGQGASELVLPDCTQLDAATMTSLMRDIATIRLERLELGSCGRGLGDEAATALGASGPLHKLVSVCLGGAYRLSDRGLAALLAVTPSMTSLSVPSANRLTAALVNQLPHLVPRLEQLSLHDCRGVAADELASALQQLPHLRRLDLHGIAEVSDATLASLGGALPALRHLCVSCCQAVGDGGVTALAAQRPELSGFAADDCVKLTDGALRALAGGCKELKVLSVRRCVKLSDVGLAVLAERGSLTQLDVSGVPGMGPDTMRALATCCKELESLDVSFCRGVPERSLGLLADRCHRMRRLVVFGCSQVSPIFLHGHSNDDLQVLGVGTFSVAAGKSQVAAQPTGPVPMEA